jgi:hypothetical protein
MNQLTQLSQTITGELYHDHCMIRLGIGQTSRSEVAVTDRLNLEDTSLISDLVKGTPYGL